MNNRTHGTIRQQNCNERGVFINERPPGHRECEVAGSVASKRMGLGPHLFVCAVRVALYKKCPLSRKNSQRPLPTAPIPSGYPEGKGSVSRSELETRRPPSVLSLPFTNRHRTDPVAGNQSPSQQTPQKSLPQASTGPLRRRFRAEASRRLTWIGSTTSLRRICIFPAGSRSTFSRQSKFTIAPRCTCRN